MKVTIEGTVKDIVALALAVQEQQKNSQICDERNALIHEYEYRLAKLKGGASPVDVIS